MGDSHNKGSSYDQIEQSKPLKSTGLGSCTCLTVEDENFLQNGAHVLLHLIHHRL